MSSATAGLRRQGRTGTPAPGVLRAVPFRHRTRVESEWGTLAQPDMRVRRVSRRQVVAVGVTVSPAHH